MQCYGRPRLSIAAAAVLLVMIGLGQMGDSAEPFFLDTPEAKWTRAVAFSGDGKYLAAIVIRGFMEHELWIWEFATRTKVAVLRDAPTNENHDIVASIAFCPDGRRIAAKGNAGRVIVWEPLDSWQRASSRQLIGPAVRRDRPDQLDYTATDGIRSMAFSPDGRFLASTRGKAVIIVRADSGEQVGELSVGRLVGPPQFTNRGDQLVVGVVGSQRQAPEVQFWDVVSLTQRKSLRVELPAGIKKPCAVAIAISADDRSLVATVGNMVHTTHDVRLFDLQKERWHILASDPAITNAPAFSADGRFLAQPTARGAGPAAVLLWDFATRTRRRLACHSAETVTDVAFSPDGRYLVAALIPPLQTRGAPNVRTVCVWELPTSESPGDLTR